MSDNEAPLTVQEIAEIAARLAAVTPGPWEVEAVSAWRPNGLIQLKAVDAEFIAHAPTDMRRLLAELQRAHDERDALAGLLMRWHDWYLDMGAPGQVRQPSPFAGLLNETTAALLERDTP